MSHGTIACPFCCSRAVPSSKGTAPFYRLMTDARFANRLYSDWGVTSTAAQLSSTLNRCDFHFSIDTSDAYHLSLWAGYGGELLPIKRPIFTSRGPGQPREVTWIDAIDGQRLCSVYVQRGLRQGHERHRNRRARVSVR